jgi:hypothetical protein
MLPIFLVVAPDLAGDGVDSSFSSSDPTHSWVDLVIGFVSCRPFQALEAQASELCLCPCACALVVVPMLLLPSVAAHVPLLNAPLYSWLHFRGHC